MTATDAEGSAAGIHTAFERGLARLLDEHGDPLGAGFLLTRDLVCTCAHLLVDLPDESSPRPDEPVLVDFPLLAEDRSAPVPATVVEWRPTDDVAVLRLAQEVAGSAPLPSAGLKARLYGREVRLYGFPEETDTGVNAHGTLRGGQGAGLIQLDAGHGSVPIQPGFSGSPVWDVEAGHLVGMLATRGRGSLAGTAYLIPARQLWAAETEVPDAGPFKGLLRFEEDDAAVFLGREQETEALDAAVRRNPVTLLAGQSGTGKSSLLRAGLLPRLRAAKAVVVVRTPQEADDPGEFLGEALLALWEAADAGAAEGATRRTAVRDALSGDGLALAQLRERLREAAGDRLGTLVLDQFEEYAAAAPPAARQVVTRLRQLTGSVSDTVPGRGLRAVLSVRHATLDVLTDALPATERPRALVDLAPLTDEALARVISEPLRSFPGAGLQDGLAELLLRDARSAQEVGGETNSLPLLAFTLVELWKRRVGGQLTLAAYQELGGLSGALAQHAEAKLQEAFEEGLADEPAARRLFQRLARPDRLGRFLPDAVPAAELDAAQLRLAQRMVREKLLAWTTPQRGGPSKESLRVAHEALLREWDWLHTCLLEGEQFRAWQAEVAEHASAWDADGRRAFVFVPRKLLSAAERWRAERGADITDVERDYLAAGRRHARRGAYVLRAFASVVTVLTLLVGWLAWDASRSRDEIARQLARAASQQLASLSEERSATDLNLSVQLAMGAWATAKTDKARAQLFGQYLRMRDVEQVHPGLWKGQVKSLTAASDTDVLAVTTAPDDSHREVRLITDVASGHPRVHRLSGIPDGSFHGVLSDDGRWYAIAGADGSVRLWRVGAQSLEPRLLTGALPGKTGDYGVPLDFSDDGSRLLRMFSRAEPTEKTSDEFTALNVWEAASGKEVAGAGHLVDDRAAVDAAFMEDRDHVGLVWNGQSPSGGFLSSAGVFDLSDGKVIRSFPDAKSDYRFAARGRLLNALGAQTNRFRSTRTGEPARAVPQGANTYDATDLYGMDISLAQRSTKSGAEYLSVGLFGLTDGSAWRAVVPTDEATGDGMYIAAWADSDGSGPPRAVAAVGDGLVSLRLTESVSPFITDPSTDHQVDFTLDSSRYATVDKGRLYLSHIGSPTRSAVLPGDPEKHDWRLTSTGTKQRPVEAVWDASGLGLHLYAADDLARRLDVDLRPRLQGASVNASIETVAQLGNGELAVLLSSNEVLRVDPRTGTLTGPALRVADPEPVPLSKWSNPGQVVPRPGHDNQALIVTRSGYYGGELMLWDLVKGTRVTNWTTAAGVYAPYNTDSQRPTALFSSDGRLVAVSHNDSKIRIWNVATHRSMGRTFPLPIDTELVAFRGTGTLVIRDDENFRLYDVNSGRAVADGPSAVGSPSPVLPTDTGIRLVYKDRIEDVALDPDTWWRSLCRGADRPYSKAERKLLPNGTHTGRPCSTS